MTSPDGGWETWRWDETLFEGTARHYWRGRYPYPPGLAKAFAEAVGGDGRGRLLDVGCGPGSVTLLLAELFEAVIGLDPDPGMLAEAEREAAARGVTNATWVRARGEDLPAGLGMFRAITFAQSFHWMDRPKVAAAVRTMLEPGGAVVQIGTWSATAQPPPPGMALRHPMPPTAALDALRIRYLGPDRRAGRNIRNTSPGGEDAVFQAAGFLPMEEVAIPDGRELIRTIDDEVALVLSMSSTAPVLFGHRLDAFVRDVRAVLEAASPSGLFSVYLDAASLRTWRLPA